MLLTIFYDRSCPLCSAEIEQLRTYDSDDQLVFEDIHAPDFVQRFPHIDQHKADRILHGQLANGDIIYGLDVTCLAWKVVGKHRWLAILRWPLIRVLADLGYNFFARHRNVIASLVTANNKPRDCQRCKLPD